MAFAQYAQTGRDTVIGLWLKGTVARLSISRHHSTHTGTSWFLATFIDTNHWSRFVHISHGNCPAVTYKTKNIN